jgi:salicylate hydroxylase
VVVGGGLGGTAAALALVQAGIDVQVYEQAQQLTEVGAGVSLAPNGLRMLERLGTGQGVARAGARYMSARLLHSDGRPARHGPHQFTQPGRNVGIHRADLLALLAGRLPAGFSQDAATATVSFADGTTAPADVVIGADGIHSVLQGFVTDAAEPVFSGVVAHRGLVPCPAGHPADTLTMWVGEGQHFLVFPVRAGQLLNYVGFVSSDTPVRESWSAHGDPAALATLLAAGTSSAGVPRALASYERLRRDRTARVQLDSRRNGAGYDSSGRQLTDRRWIYEYDAWAEAAALT